MGNTQMVYIANAMDEAVFVRYNHEREAVRCSNFLSDNCHSATEATFPQTDSRTASVWRWADIESEFQRLDPKAVLSLRRAEPNQKGMFISVIAQSGRLLADSKEIKYQENIIISNYGQLLLAQSHQVWVDKRGRDHLSNKTRRDSYGLDGMILG